MPRPPSALGVQILFQANREKKTVSIEIEELFHRIGFLNDVAPFDAVKSNIVLNYPHPCAHENINSLLQLLQKSISTFVKQWNMRSLIIQNSGQNLIHVIDFILFWF